MCRYLIFEGNQIKRSPDRERIIAEVVDIFSRLNWHSTPSLLKAQAILILGGDGAMIDATTKYYGRHIPFYGLNFGSVGFLLNQYDEKTIIDLVSNPILVPVKLLHVEAYNSDGLLIGDFFAINDILVERSSGQTILLNVSINQEEYWNQLRCDGVLFSSPVGSTAYNYQTGGPILPLKANLNILTPINGADAERVLILNDDIVTISTEPNRHRPIRCYIDGRLIRDVIKVTISTSQVVVNLGFASSQDLHTKIKRRQFAQHHKI